MVTLSTKLGVLEGVERPGAVSFLGVPYAAPPIGALRWRAPAPPAPWSGAHRATRHPNRAHQAPFPPDLAPPGGIPGDLSEDMLYLNVHTPALGGPPRPVDGYAAYE
jgi:para-nitrobenzyl esterase